MSSPIPEGYAVAPIVTDHLMKIAVPIKGRDPILIEAPKAAWTPPKEIDAVKKWLDPIIEAESERNMWHADNDHVEKDKQTPFPIDAAALCGERGTEKSRLVVRESKIRFLKPYLSAAHYKLLIESKDIAERTIDWIVEQATSPDITAGESGASTDS